MARKKDLVSNELTWDERHPSVYSANQVDISYIVAQKSKSGKVHKATPRIRHSKKATK